MTFGARKFGRLTLMCAGTQWLPMVHLGWKSAWKRFGIRARRRGRWLAGEDNDNARGAGREQG